MNIIPAKTADVRWQMKSGFGNHRILVEAKAGRYVRASLTWRRRDLHPETIGVRIRYTADGIGSEDGIGCGTVENCHIVKAERGEGILVFEAPADGIYEIYYMPFTFLDPWHSPFTAYLPAADTTVTEEWLTGLNTASCIEATVLRYESRTEFDSFYPMEFPMTAEERTAFEGNVPFALITESRLRPIRMKYELPVFWQQRSAEDRSTLTDTVCRNEHYAFQLAVSAQQNLENIHVLFRDADGNPIPEESCICFNLRGRDLSGVMYDIRRDVRAGEILSLWCGVRMEDFADCSDTLAFTAEVAADNCDAVQTAEIRLQIENTYLNNNGDDDLWRMSRLFWLNSDIGLNDDIIAPYQPIGLGDDITTMDIMGKTVKLGALGLPTQIVSCYDDTVQYSEENTELLAAPIDLLVTKASAAACGAQDTTLRREEKNAVHTVICADAVRNDIAISAHIDYESDGHIDCRLTLTAQAEDDYTFTLQIPFANDAAQMFMGMSYVGGHVPSQWEYRWDTGHVGNYAWVGGVRAGLQLKLMPEADAWGKTTAFDSLWKNSGRGKMIVYRTKNAVILEGRTGTVHMAEGETHVLHFHMITTPFHPIDTDHHWHQHIYHTDGWGEERCPNLDRAKANGATMINLHQGGMLNENINYPFVVAPKLKEHVTRAHDMGMRYKLYYTVRELSNYCAELWAFRALGDEIYSGTNSPTIIADYFLDKKTADYKSGEAVTTKRGGAWLHEHLVEGFSGAWHQYLYDGEFDCAIGTQPLSRLHNYYLCGLDWLIREVGVDGLYLDGIGYDRSVMKRVRRVMQESGKNCDIDIHCGNDHEMPCYGYVSPANLYLEHFAYANSLWNGEGYYYEEVSPEYYLIESSGIPFGLMGEMLHGGGNPWRGMVYGMTARLGWQQGGICREIWDLWEAFGIADAEMLGWWNPACPVTAEDDSVRTTVYRKPDGTVLIAVASWYPVDKTFLFSVNCEQLGIDGDFEFYAPAIPKVQEEAVFSKYDLIPIAANKGWLFYLREKK